MVQALDARTLRFQDVHRLLDLHRGSTVSAASLLSLPDLTEGDLETLDRITAVLEAHYNAGRISEGEIKFLALSPLLWLAGYYHPEIQISLEEDIADIEIPDRDLLIKGRMDLLAAHRGERSLVWILVLETKNSEAAALTGVPQLLTYLYLGLDHQHSVWGLATNGIEYQFVYLQQEDQLQYQLLPLLALLNEENRQEVVRIHQGISSLERGLDQQDVPVHVLGRQPRSQGNRVNLGAMHRAKGLEFKVVFIAGASDDQVPLKQVIERTSDPSIRRESLEKERHLLYISLTRARDELLISWVGKPSRWLP